MEERLRFVRDAHSDRFTMSELCARYGVSRRVGHKWLARYEEEGRQGLVDRDRTPRHCPHRTSTRIAELLVAAREQHPQWGARKLLRVRPAVQRARAVGRVAGSPETRTPVAERTMTTSGWVAPQEICPARRTPRSQRSHRANR